MRCRKEFIMRKLMSTIAIIGMLFGMSSKVSAEAIVEHEGCEGCGSNISMVYDEENAIYYEDEFYLSLYQDYYVYTNHCEECGADYYEYCDCVYNECFSEVWDCGEYHYPDDYQAFVNDYVDYESNCTEYCEGCDRYYYSVCDEEEDFYVYYMDLQYLEMIQEESTEL